MTPRILPDVRRDLLERGVPEWLLDDVETRTAVPPPLLRPPQLPEELERRFRNKGVSEADIQLANDAVAGRLAGHLALVTIETEQEQLALERQRQATRARQQKSRLVRTYIPAPAGSPDLVPPGEELVSRSAAEREAHKREMAAARKARQRQRQRNLRSA